MHVLLINANPVVSRLFVLCAGEVGVKLEEVSRVDTVKDEQYTMVFVDESAYEESILGVFHDFKNIKKVFISYTNESMDGFDFTIAKPFLPSSIVELFESNMDNTTTQEEEDETLLEEIDNVMLDEPKEALIENIYTPIEEESIDNNTNILNIDEIEKIKDILENDEQEELEDLLSQEDIEVRKVELIKKQLIDEGVEIVEENEIVNGLDIDIHQKPLKKKTKKSKQAKIILTEDILQENLTKKQMRKLLRGKKIMVSMKLQGHS